jgi:DNA anti-recombination protein RmuC
MPCPAERILRLSPTYALEHCVPVTARLSKRFYDVLGEDVANELVDWFNAVDLTYRADLRELNELNYARFEAKLEQRLAELRAELRQEIGDLRADLRTELAGLRAEIRTELQEVRTEVHQGNTALERVRGELLRWMFGFWVTTFIGVAGLLIALGNR